MLNKVLKKQNYITSLLVGMSSFILPTFFQTSDIPKIEGSKLTASQQVRLDYARSLVEIKKEASKFGYK